MELGTEPNWLKMLILLIGFIVCAIGIIFWLCFVPKWVDKLTEMAEKKWPGKINEVPKEQSDPDL